MIFKQYDQLMHKNRPWKGQSRRVLKKNEYLAVDANGVPSELRYIDAHGVTRRKHYVGQVIAVVPKRGQKGVGHARILAIREEPLQAITPEDAVAEGVADVAAYHALWQSINGKTCGVTWDDNPTIVVYTLEPLFAVGDRVRISADAFPGSDEPGDLAARGQVGVVKGWDETNGDRLYYVDVDGILTCPVVDELEFVDRFTATLP